MNHLPPRLEPAQATLLVVDFQAKLAPHIHGGPAAAARAVQMLRAARVLGLPVMVCQQYTAGLGPTLPEIAEAAGAAAIFEKSTFSACGDGGLLASLRIGERPIVLIAGIETHVCVQQTVLDLLRAGAAPVVLADAVGARRELDHAVALDLMRAAGARVTTNESAIFELTGRCDGPVFKDILRLVK